MDNQYNFYNFEALFKEYLLAGNKKPVSIKNYLSDLRHFIGWLILKLKVKNQKLKIDNNCVTANLIEEYKTYLFENKIPVKTINRRLSTLRKFCSFCISQGWMKENPAKKILNVKCQKSKLEINEILNQFHQDLLKENLDKTTIKSYLNDVQEFLSV